MARHSSVPPALTGPGRTASATCRSSSKYALFNDRATGDVFSGGLVITVPTGGGITIDYPGLTSGIVDGTNTTTF